tara:strand:+ start:192 stop:395 length:204 start_codon:yes stop_codon:yes gene_type:complete
MVLYVRQVMVKKYFHEVIEEEEKILAIGLKQSRLHKAERLSREKNIQGKNSQEVDKKANSLSTHKKG